MLHLGSGSFLWAGPSPRGRIAIGDDVTFGPRVMVTAANYRFNDGQPVRSNAMDEREIVNGIRSPFGFNFHHSVMALSLIPLL